MRTITSLTLRCPEGFKYQPGNKVLATVGNKNVNVGDSIAALWNAWWDSEDQYDPEDPDEPDLHNLCRLQFDGWYLIVNAAESYTLRDFAASLEEILRFPILVDETEEVT